MNGYWVFSPPIGYRYEKVEGHGKILVRNESFASIVGEAFESYASGRFETFSEVKRFLEAQPVWPKGYKGEVHFERIKELFSRPVYAGHISHEAWGLTLVQGKHEPLISLATWQAVQDRRDGVAKAPAKKNISEDFPLRGFVTCGCCGHAMTAAWSKGRNKLYPYYLCDTKGCPDYRKSIRKEKIEGEFTALLASLKPSEGLFNLAFDMFRDLWNAKLSSSQNQGATLRKDIAAIEKKIDQFLERVTEADSDILITAYERKIKELTTQKALLSERAANCGKPLKTFGEAYRTAFDFLANPCKLWLSDRLEDQRAVLRLVFAERLPYLRNHGYRTAKISTPFKMLGDANMLENGMVPPPGLEPGTP
ncbi:recombinase zinc beta ribbon domain-containing protein [Shinella sp.]|uniref:recombinase zinc beta ribbon domain-containing protein n=1 Tax=Shinella sp. TaxID=1870904 RepID=UPI0029A88B86|nr:recombinase zinc beta ribbon domain-containing protein [Shinella sp.]MDX3973501.1 recombinase zinc beta ribbon domain-containing protein [Shinella sp.]